MGPQEAPQRLVPPLRLTEKVAKFFLIRSAVFSACDLNLDLAAQHDGIKRLRGIRVLQVHFERDGRGSCELHGFHTGDSYGEVRHSRSQRPSAATWLSFGRRIPRSASIPRRLRPSPTNGS